MHTHIGTHTDTSSFIYLVVTVTRVNYNRETQVCVHFNDGYEDERNVYMFVSVVYLLERCRLTQKRSGSYFNLKRRLQLLFFQKLWQMCLNIVSVVLFLSCHILVSIARDRYNKSILCTCLRINLYFEQRQLYLDEKDND